MELHRAIAQLSDIHAQVLRSELFRGYRAVPTAISSGIAVVAALLQSSIVSAATPTEFVVQWSGVAALAAAICAADLWLRARRSPTVAKRVLPVVGQFLPAIAVGGVLTIVLLRTASPMISVLPGVWAMLMGVGIMAMRPYLPRAIGFVAAFYVAVGGVLVVTAQPAAVPNPWTMGAVFGVGQAAAATVLFLNLERGGRGD